MRLTWTVLAETAIVVTLHRGSGPLQQRFAERLERTLREEYLARAVSQLARELRGDEDGDAADAGSVLDILARVLVSQEERLGCIPRLSQVHSGYPEPADRVTELYLINFPGAGRPTREADGDDLARFVTASLGPQRWVS